MPSQRVSREDWVHFLACIELYLIHPLPCPLQLLEIVAHSDRNVVNPYVYFGQPSMWPRGYLLDAIALNNPKPSYLKADSSVKPLIQQGLANGDPDLDAIFRLTQATKGQLIRVEFDGEAQPIALPRGTMCPYNAQTTLHTYENFPLLGRGQRELSSVILKIGLLVSISAQ